MRKVCVVIASRANYGRLKSVIKAIDEHPALKLQLVVGASALQGIDVGYEPDARIQCLVEGDNLQAMTLTTGLFLTQLGGALERLLPDVVLVHGDRYEMLAVAIAASYLNIPLAHTEGGETTGTIDEKVRHAVTKLADIHFPVTKLAAKRIVAMGASQKAVHVVGSTALDSLVGIDMTNTRECPYVVILHHPNTTDPEDITELVEAVNMLECHKVWVNPNVDPGSRAMLKIIHRQDIEFIKHLPPEEYARLIYNSKCLIGNTSSGIKEGAFLGVPYVCVGNRQWGREHGRNVKFVRYDRYEIITTAHSARRHLPDYRFGNGIAGKKVAEILAGGVRC